MTTNVSVVVDAADEWPIVSDSDPEIDAQEWGVLEIIAQVRDYPAHRDFHDLDDLLSQALDRFGAEFEARSFTPAATFPNRLAEGKFIKRGLWPQDPAGSTAVDRQTAELRTYADGSKQFVGTYAPSTGRGLLNLLSPQYTLGSTQTRLVRSPNDDARRANIFGDASSSIDYRRLLLSSLKHRLRGEVIVLKFGLFDDLEFGYSLLSDREVVNTIHSLYPQSN